MRLTKAFASLIGAVLISASVAACGGNAAQPAAPSQSEGNFKIELTTEPSPLTMGDVTFIITLKDRQDNPVEGAVVNVSYSMTTMNMGVTSGEASEDGDGKYSIRSRIDHGGGLKLAVEVEKEGLGKGVKDYRLEIK